MMYIDNGYYIDISVKCNQLMVTENAKANVRWIGRKHHEV